MIHWWPVYFECFILNHFLLFINLSKSSLHLVTFDQIAIIKMVSLVLDLLINFFDVLIFNFFEQI